MNRVLIVCGRRLLAVGWGISGDKPVGRRPGS